MNRRIRKKRYKLACLGHKTKKQREKNKTLCKRYPFLIPRQVWTDKIAWLNKPYDWTLAEDFPKGWWKAFGLQLCEELKEELIKYNYLDKYRISEIKSKFAELRIYDEGAPEGCDVWNIIEDYSLISQNVCEYCGKPDIATINWGGWYASICEDCYNKIQQRNKRNSEPIPYSHWEKLSEPYIKDERKYTRTFRRELVLDIGEWNEYVQIYKEFQKSDRFRINNNGMITERMTEYHIRDLKEKAERIRARWKNLKLE